MADDLIDFSELENDENCCPDEDLENRAPKLVQSPVIVNPILKQSTKDNLIQLYTPVQRPVKGKLKVTFGEDSVLQTPIVKKAEKRTVKSDVTIEEVKQEQTAEDKEKQEREEWEERTSILTSIDHQDYTGYARDFIEEIIQSIPIKEDSPHSVDSGVESMDCCEYEAEPIQFPVNSDINQNCTDDNAEAEMSFTTSILSYATDLLKSLQQENKSQDTNLTDLHIAKESETAAESEEEFMDCEEYMDVDNGELTVPQSKETVPNNRETVPENTETIPQNNDTVKPNNATVTQNNETVPQSKEKVPENKESVPQNAETLTQDYETVPQNSSVVPPNNKAVEQNSEPEQQNKETVPQNNGSVQQNTETEPHNETLPQNSETVPHNNVTDITATNSILEITDGGVRTTAEMKTISDPALDNACEVRSTIEANFAGEPSGENNKTNIENTIQTSNAENKQDLNNIGNDMHEETVSLKANCTDKQSERVDDVSGKQKSKENTDKEAISDDQTNEAHTKNIPASSIEDQPILPKKGFYNLDELDLESMDPFKPKTQISNTPDKTSQDKALSVDNEEQDVNIGTCMESSKINPPDKSDEKIDLKDTKATSEMDKVVLPESEVVIHNDNTPDNTGESKQGEIQNEGQNEMSSDEMQSFDKNPKENIPTTSTEEEPILPKKGVYNLDELDLESMDPFKPKTQIVNTPDKSNQGKTAMVGHDENTCDGTGESQNEEMKNEGPTRVSSDTIQDSAKSPNMDVDVCTTKKSPKRQEQKSSETLLMETEGMVDPFRPRKQMQNSPVMPNKTVGKLELVSADMSAESELKTCATENSTADTRDITKVSFHLQNSAITQDQVTEEPKEENMKEPPHISKALEKVQDSEPRPKDEQDFAEITDPFKPRKQMQNSPVVKGAATSAINFDEIEDPFKPSKQMQNSPSAKTENDTEDVLNGDDFTVVKKQEQNSTVAKDLNTKFEDIENPFKPNNQMLNSPVVKQKVLESGTDSQDAFKTNSKLTSSPLSVKLNTKDCIDTDTGARLQGDMNNSNKNQDSSLDLLEMPSLDGIENPFKPSKQMQNSPLSKQNTEVDSERKSTINGGQPDVPKDKSQTESIADPKFDAFDDIDPFKTYRQIPQTPDKDQVETGGKSESNESTEQTPKVEKMDGLCSAETEVKTPTNKENKQTDRGTGATDTVEPEEEDDNCFEITNVTRRGDVPKDARIGNFDGLSIDESQFVSAAQVFNEPGMLDLLEQFGDTSSKQQESSLSRMSLYVKFDPLVEAAPNPRRISIRPDQLEKMREYGLDETLLLLGTPPKKKRQSLSVSFLKNTPDSRLLLNKKREPVRVQPGEVDMILACSPDEKKEETPACSSIPPFSSLVDDITAADTGIFEELKYTETDLKKVKNGLKMEMEGILLEKKREFYAKEQALNKEREKFETINSELKRKCVSLEENNTKLNGVMKMYEQTFVDVAEKHKAELQKVQQEKTKIKEERDSVMNDNLSVEKAFTELHARYDKLKNIIDGLKKNDEAMKKYVSECQENITAKDKKLGTMKKSYEEKCKQLQQENEKLKQQYDESVSKSEARAKVSQMKIESLEKQLEQKMAENKELAEICDKLLAVQQDS